MWSRLPTRIGYGFSMTDRDATDVVRKGALPASKRSILKRAKCPETKAGMPRDL